MNVMKDILEVMRRNPAGVRFKDAAKCAVHYFGEPRIHGSHYVFSMP